MSHEGAPRRRVHLPPPVFQPARDAFSSEVRNRAPAARTSHSARIAKAPLGIVDAGSPRGINRALARRLD